MADSLLNPQSTAPTFNEVLARKTAELNDAKQRIAPQIQYVTVATDNGQLNPVQQAILDKQNQQEAARQSIIAAGQADKTDHGLTSTANLNSNNPFINLGSNALNLGEQVVQGAANVGTQVVAAGYSLPALGRSMAVPDAARDAYNVYTTNTAQRQELAKQSSALDAGLLKGTLNKEYVAAKQADLQKQAAALTEATQSSAALLNQPDASGKTYMQILDGIQADRKTAAQLTGKVQDDSGASQWAGIVGNMANNKVTDVITNAVKDNQYVKNTDAQATADFAAGNTWSGIGNTALAFSAGMLGTLKEGVKHPLAGLNLAAQNLAQVAARPITIASAIANAADQNVGSHQQFTNNTGQQFGTVGQDAAMAGISALHAGVDYIADNTLGKILHDKPGNLLDRGVNVPSRTMGKATLGLVGDPVKNIGKLITPEIVSEGAQQAIEDNYGALNPKFDSASVGNAAGIGGVASLGTSGHKAVLNGLASAGVDLLGATNAGQNAIANAKQRQATDAIPTEELTNIAHPSYNPTAAVQRFGNELTPATTPEQAVDIKTRINDVTGKLDEMVTGLQDRIDAYPEEAAKMERNKAKFAQARIDNANDPEVLKQIDDKEAARQAIFDTQFGTGSTVESLTATLKVKQQQLLQTDQFASKYNTIIDSRFPDAVNASKQAQNAPVSNPVKPVVQTPVVQSNAVPTATPAPANIFMNQYISPNDAEFNHPGINTTLLPNGNYKVIGRVDPHGNWVGTPKEDVDTNATPTTVTDQSVPDVSTTPISTTEPVQQSKKDFDDIVSSYPSESTSIAASKLADDTSNDLTDTQRTTLRKLSDAIVVANRTKTLGDVSKDVIEGSKGYRGLNQYISSMMNAVRAGKKAVQGALVGDINSFNDDHAQKAQLARQAMDMAPKGMAQEVLRTKSGWELGKQIPISQAMSKKYQAEMKKSGSLAIHSGSETIVKGIEDESSAISVVADTLKAIHESQQAPKQPSKAQEDTLDAELEQITGKKVVVPTEAPKPIPKTIEGIQSELDTFKGKDIQDLTKADEQRKSDLQDALESKVKEQAAVTKAEPRVEAKPVTGKAEPVKKESTPQEALDKFNEQDRAERQAKNESRQVSEMAKTVEATISHDESVPVEETPIVTSEDSADIQPEAVNAEASEPVEKAKPVKGITAIQATKEERAQLREDMKVDNGKTTTGYQKVNLVKALFTQKATSLLSTVKDLLSSTTDKGVELMTKVLGTAPTAKQQELFDVFTRFAKHQQKSYRDLMNNRANESKNTGEFNFKDYLQYLYEGKAEHMEENITTAASVAAFGWLVENGKKFRLDSDAVKSLLGEPNAPNLPYSTYSRFSTIGSQRGNVIRSLGSRVYEALGMSVAKDVDAAHKDRFINALGSMVLQTLIDQNLVQLTPIPKAELSAAIRSLTGETLPSIADLELAAANGGQKEAEALAKRIKTDKAEALEINFFIRAAHKTEVVDGKENSLGVSKLIDTLIEANKGTDGLMSKLFGVTSREIAPLTKKPTEFNQAVIDDAGTEVASHLAENVLKASQTAYGVSNLNTVYGNLHDSHRELLLGMLGYKSASQLADMHVSNRESAEAVNESILRSLDNAFETIGSLRLGESDNYSNFYLPMKVWAVNRVGVMSNMLNEQGDKIHRSLVHVAAHKQEVTIGEPFVDGKITQFGKFLLAVAGGMEGTKSIVGFTSDKTTAGEFIPRFEAYLATPKVQTAIAAMQAIKSGKYSDGDVALVAEIIQEFGMSPMSMAALNALAEYQSGKDSGGVFTTDVSLESDGVTSGSAISLLVYGVTDQTKLAAAGFYTEGDNTPNISTYRAEGKKDLYLQLADQMKAQWQALVLDGTIPSTIVSAFSFFDRAFGTREGAKGVQTPLIYGSGFKAINAANTSALVQSIYNRLQEIALMPDQVRTEALKTFVGHYNQLAKAAGFPTKVESLFTGMTKEDLLAFEMDSTSIKLLGEYNATTRGKAIKAAVENVVGDMLAVRTNLFAATGAGFTVFNALFKAVYADTVAELKAKGELLIRTDRLGREIPFEDLSPDQLQEVFDKLSKYDSRVNTADGVVSDNTKASAMPTYNVTKEVIEADPLNPGIEAQYKSEHKFKRAPYVTNSTFTLGSIRSLTTTNKDGDTKYIQVGKSESIATYSRKTVLESKGASVSATLIQGIDAFVSAMTQALHRAAGHHDANTGSIDDAEFMAQTQNKVLMDAVIKTHINSNAIDAVLNPLLGIISKEHSHLFNKAEAYAIRREALSSINLGRAYGEKYPSLEVALKSMIKTAYKADLAKLNVIEKLATVSQYSLEGGQVKLSQEQRDTIAKEREALRTKYTSVMESVDVINKGINNFKPSPKPVVIAPVVQPTVVEQPVTVVATQTTTEQFLSNYDGGLVPHQELFDHLRAEFKGKKGWYAAGQRSLLELVARVLPKDLPINVVTELSATKDTKWYRDDKSHEARAWANSSGITYRLDRDSIHPEVLLHEMVHAITSRALTNPDYKDVQTTLQGLLDTAKAKYDAQSDKSMYDKEQQRIFNHAFSNIKEFTAIAMSNRDMQNFLDRIIIPRTEAKPGLATMFQKFIKSIGSILNKAAGRTTPLDSNTQSVLEATIYNTTQVIQTQLNDAQNQGFDLQSSYPHEQAKADALKKATQYTAAEVFNVLDGSGISSEFNAHLAGVIATVVDNTYSVLEAHDLTGSDTAGYTPYQVWNEKLSQGKVPYASTAMATGFNLSEKELFAVESIEASLNAAMNNGVGTAVHKELKAAFLKARESLKDERVFFAGDWSKASQQQRDQALAKYNLVFKLVGNTNKQEENAYLSRFAALALGSQEFSALLDFPVYTQENRGDKSLSSSISNYFDTAMQWVNGYLSKTVSNQTIKDKLPILAQQLIEIDHKKRDAALPGILDKLHTVQEIGNEVIQDASEKLADKLKGVRGTKVVQTVLKGKVMDNLDVLKDARNKENPNSVLGVAAELLSELANANTAQQGMQKLFRQHEVVQNTRKGMITAMTKNVLNTFIDGGKNLKQKQLEAVTYGLLRTNAQALLSTYGVKGIQDFVGDTVKRNAEITKLEKQVNNPLHINRTKDLAWYMASGEPRDSVTKNTTNILRDMGTGKELTEDQVSKESIELLDKLNALYAIEYTRSDRREDLKQLITGELARKGVNGIEATLAYHRGLVEDSRDTLFEGNSASRIQGWLPEIVNQHREVAIATNEGDAKELERLGFHLHSQPKTDPNDPVSGTRKLYMTEESTKTRYTTGALSLTTTARKGTSVFTGSDVKGKAAYQAIDKMNKRTAAYLAQHTDPNYDPRKGNTSMIPTYANDGSIIDYNYEMSHESRDSLLQRNNNFAQILGSYAGTNYDKMESPKHNDVVLKAIHDQFLEGYAASPEAYVEISPHANDPRLREIYAMLPHDAKQTMEKLWGKGEPMMIRNDLVLSTFGARKLTIGSAFDKNPEQRNMIENTVVSTLEAMFGDQAKLKGLRAERAWQEVALTMKSFVVIRNVKTLIGNQMSNTGILMAMGVNPIDIYQDSAIALKGALQYRKDTAIIINANQQLRAGLGIPSEHHQDILRAQDSLARNPVRDFIAAGMLSSIVEDVSLEEDPYSYKSKYAQRLDEMTGGVPDGVKTTLSYAFVSPKTPLYQLLADATQFSDFTAKYVLYKNSTTKAKKKLSHDEAINLADKMFINYGVPTSPELQYMNDMGFLMFTKYTLRIQRAMAHLLKEHPAGTLGEVLLANQMGSVSVLDPLFLNNIQNPLRTGILGMPSVIDEPFPVAMLKGLLF